MALQPSHAPPPAVAQPRLRVSPRPVTGSPRLSVVVVNYRQWHKTAAVVRQLLAARALRQGDAEVVILDNHSPRHPLARKLRRLPGVSLRRWDKNHGFAKAVNEGCRLSQGDWFLLLNPDITLSEGFLDGVLELAERLESDDPRAGIVGFHLRNPDGSQQLSAGPFPTFWRTLARLALSRSRRKYQALRGGSRTQVSWVTGCCLLVRRACMEGLGGLDEDYFLYYEDVDLCRRARAAGWTVHYEPSLALVHHFPLHNRPLPTSLRLATRHSLLTYARKHWTPWQFRWLARLVRAEAAWRKLFAWWRGDPRQVEHYRELSRMARELQRRQAEAARRRLDRALERLDVRVGV